MTSNEPCWLFVLASCLALSGPARAGPEIFALTPETGPAGTPVQIKGTGLKTTKHVVFAVGRTVKTARFRIVSDEELQVVAPEYYRPNAAATVAVVTPSGLAVAMPAAVQTIRAPTPGRSGKEPGAGFYHVLSGGKVNSAESVALIEPGGMVDRSRTPAMHLVKRGGVLREFSNPNGIVFAESGAILGPQLFDLRRSEVKRFIRVARITGSPGVGPFIYQGVPRPDLGETPAVPPSIGSVVPSAAVAGDVITLQGKGLARTTEALFVDHQGHARPAGFRILSDRQLKVEVPDLDAAAGPQLVAVVTTEGLTITIPRHRTIRPGPAMAMAPRAKIPHDAILWIGPGDRAPAGARQLIFIARGGVVSGAVAGNICFVQRGGMLAQDAGRPRAVYFEPEAILPERLKRAPIGHEARAIIPSFFNEPFVILPGPLFRP